MHRMVATIATLSLVSFSAAGQNKTFQHDQYDPNIFQAANQINGALLQVEPGFVQAEAYGALFRPNLDEYPIKLLGVDVFFAGPQGYELDTSVSIELYLNAGAGPAPTNEVPDFVIDSTEFLNPSSGEFGVSIEPNNAYQFDFAYDQEGGAPPQVTQGNILVMVRFKEPASDLSLEWGTKGTQSCIDDSQCGIFPPGVCDNGTCVTPLMECSDAEVLGIQVGCGCQPVGMILDADGLSPQTNIMHLVWPLGTCSGSKEWKYFEEIQSSGKSLGGDVIIRLRADTSSTGPTCSCTGKDCGDDGCGNSCGTCLEGQTCDSGLCTGSACGCEGIECGPDACGTTCGTCELGQTCDAGQCIGTPCSCDTKQCGDDGCGNSCGTCPDGETCSDAGLCEPECSCDGKQCGDDGCGTLCGVCGDGTNCEDNQCVDDDSGTPGDQLDASDASESSDATDATDTTDGVDTSDDLIIDAISITSIDPDFGKSDEQTPIVIIGTGFVDGTEIKVGGRDLIAVQLTGPSLIEGTVPSGLNPGIYSVIAVRPDGQTAALEDAFTIEEERVSSTISEDRVSTTSIPSGGCSTSPGGSPAPIVFCTVIVLGILMMRRKAA